VREILRHEVDLFRSLQLEKLSLANDFIAKERAVLPAHQRNRAERTPVITTLAHLEVSHVRQ